MITKAAKLTRAERRAKHRLSHGIYVDGDYDELASIMARYPSSIVTLETALSLHGIIDAFVSPPFFLSFGLGYRLVKEKGVVQIWEDDSTRRIGTLTMERDGIEFLCYDKERLLIELFRRESRIGMEAMRQAVFYYRAAANEGKLNLPRIREYCKALPKGEKYREKIRREIL